MLALFPDELEARKSLRAFCLQPEICWGTDFEGIDQQDLAVELGQGL